MGDILTSHDVLVNSPCRATRHGANTYCHWFQPLASSGVRHGQSGQVYNMMLKFDNQTNEIKYDFDGGDLVKGETDGSSYPNGGLRATHTAGAYLAIDTSSPIFLRGDTIFIPSVCVSYYGMALDEKTPLLRANDAMSNQGKRLLEHLGLKCSGLKANIGLEQELVSRKILEKLILTGLGRSLMCISHTSIMCLAAVQFLISREQYYRRPDLQFTGRTVMGKVAPRDQEMCDHYMAPLSSSSPALQCMKEIQEECWKMGIPLKTRHREVAPNQFEFAPLYGMNTAQIDQNLIVMQLIEEIAAKHGLAALLQEKPFDGINGSGKHNNWSISTLEDVPLFVPTALNAACKNTNAFPIIMAAVIAAVDSHGDLMRMAISSPGNDFRLGACEAPPAIMSTHLGDDMTSYLEAFRNGESKEYTPNLRTIDVGVSGIAPFTVPAEDRNRTSPFPYGGARFEFRAVGSSQNVSMVNTVLNSMCAQKFGEFADQIDAGADPVEVAREALNEHWKVIFNGDGYDLDNQQILTDKGVWRIDSGVEAIAQLTTEKNVALFESLGVMSSVELTARQNVLHDHYTGTVEMEAGTMIDMINQHVLPSLQGAGLEDDEIEDSVDILKKALHEIEETEESYEKAKLARVLRLETMVDIRKLCDAAEAYVPARLWTLATYKDLLFLDSHTGPTMDM
jgi:glutamine synthetase